MRWAWSRVRPFGWWIGDRARAQIIASDGAVIAELPGPAARLIELDEELLAIGDDRVWLCSRHDATLDERPLPTGLAAEARIASVGGRRVAFIGPGDHSVRIVDLDTEVGLQLWPLEGRVSHHGPQLAVSEDRRTLVWCHVIASVDRVDLERGGYPRSLARPPAPTGDVSAPVFPAEFAERLVVFDDGDVALARGVADGIEIQALAGEGDRAPMRWTIPGPARPLDLGRGRALVLGDREVQLWATPEHQAARLLGRADAAGAVSARLLPDDRALLGDARGRAWIATLEGPCDPS